MIGRSNVGKSTLLNSLVGSKVAITSPKPQTTRLPVQGIITSGNSQIVFVDTPGIMQKAKDELTKKMLRAVKDALDGVDIILYVVDPTREIGDEEKATLRLIKEINREKFLVINKIDVRNPQYLDFYKDLGEEFDQVIEVSALRKTHLKELVSIILEKLPEGEFYYPEHQITSMPNKLWLAELIREKLFLRLRQEVPYTVHVEVKEVEERENGLVYLKAVIYTSEERYKSMIIGKGGRGIKEIGQSTRNELEQATGHKYFLDLEVDVDPHWTKRIG